jgi:peptide/nickel transport system substrate-binding protein
VRRALTVAGLAAGAALLLVAAGSPRGIKEGGTFRIATGVNAIDPALANLALALEPACGMLMRYPDKPPPAGVRVAPDLAEAEPAVSRDGKTYTFTIREDARFSDGKPVTARAFVHALERILDPAMESFRANGFRDVVGARRMIAGKATTLAGADAKGKKLTLRLSKPVPDFLARTADLCVVPASLPADPEGAKAPLPSPAPYYVAEYVPGERLVLERNRFYRGERVHHVDRFVADLAVDASAVDQVASGTFDTAIPFAPFVARRAAELARRYGLNKSQFFVAPGNGLRLFHLNTSQPLFRKNPRLRQAVNYAVDRRALAREAGVVAGGVFVEPPTDQYLLPHFPGYQNTRIYPLKGPDLHTARKLAKGHTRGGKAVLYTSTSLGDAARAEILKRNLQAIGLKLEVKKFPAPLEKLATPGEPWDIGRVLYFVSPDPGYLNSFFDGRTIGQPESANWSSFNSPKYNRLLDRASRLTGEERYRAYGELDVLLSRDAAPMIPISGTNLFTFVSPRVGCVVLNGFADLALTAVCLK